METRREVALPPSRWDGSSPRRGYLPGRGDGVRVQSLDPNPSTSQPSTRDSVGISPVCGGWVPGVLGSVFSPMKQGPVRERSTFQKESGAGGRETDIPRQGEEIGRTRDVSQPLNPKG